MSAAASTSRRQTPGLASAPHPIRPGRARIGWMQPAQAEPLLAGGPATTDATAAQVARAQAARDVVAA